MGVPKFFRYISERYPCLSEIVKEHQIPEFDNLYLDMNGIIHNCSHPDDEDPHFRISEEKIFQDIFHYIEILFRMIKPRKLFFMAVDGVAPRAKMNQQRARRFRSAKDAERLEEKAKKKGEILPPEDRFDSNCITPGTVFMAKLQDQLKYFVVNKISTDKLWQKCTIILSGHETPGEGEHKIMDYIRYMRSRPGYDPNTRHCLYGLDADLIMLGLCTHEPHFSLLREEVKFGRKANAKKSAPESINFYLLHLSLMREYLELEFKELESSNQLNFKYDFEKIIDDWVLMGFLVGNDFIPHLPNLHIAQGALPVLYKTYMKVLPTFNGYINEAGSLNLTRFEKFMESLAELDFDSFQEQLADLKYFEAKTGHKPNYRTRESYKLEKWNEDGDDSMEFEALEPEKPRNLELENLIKKTEDDLFSDADRLKLESLNLDGDDAGEDSASDKSDSELWVLEFKQHKTDYYTSKLDYENVTPEVLRAQAEGYVRAIQWNLNYYYNGCCSWSWYYPHHYAPYISDIKGFSDLKIEFDMGTPFKPYEQLLAVLPPGSKKLLPTPYHTLMLDETSLIKGFYPQDFATDLNGKKAEWEAVVLIPFIDEKTLLDAMEPCSLQLSPEEKKRNTHGPMSIYNYTPKLQDPYDAPEYFSRVVNNFAACTTLTMENILVPLDKLIKGAYPGVKQDIYFPGFPTTKHLEYTHRVENIKVRVHEQPSRSESIVLTLKTSELVPELLRVAKELVGQVVYVAWPHLTEALVVSVSDKFIRYNITGEVGKYSKVENKGNLEKDWQVECSQVSDYYKTRFGIEMGPVSILVHVKVLAGRKYMFSQHGRITLEKQWNVSKTAYPLQAIVRDILVHDDYHSAFRGIESVFPVGSNCFMLGHPCYGCGGEIKDSKDIAKNGRLRIMIKSCDEPDLQAIRDLESQIRTKYMTSHDAASRLAISRMLFSRMTGSVLVSASSRFHTTDETSKINIGLNLKFSKRNEEVPGYTKKEGTCWYYSEKAVELVGRFRDFCPKLFAYLNVHNDNTFYLEDIFPDNDGKERSSEITKWIKSQPFYSVERRACGSQLLDPEVVSKLEETIDEYNKTCKTTSVQMQVKPHVLYKPDLFMGNVAPDENTKFQLYDRVVNVRESYTVPLGLRGTVIAVHRSNSGKDLDMVYDILFDEPFPGGLSLNCSANRGYRLPRSALINKSHGQRIYDQRCGPTQPQRQNSDQPQKQQFFYPQYSSIINTFNPALNASPENHHRPFPIPQNVSSVAVQALQAHWNCSPPKNEKKQSPAKAVNISGSRKVSVADKSISSNAKSPKVEPKNVPVANKESVKDGDKPSIILKQMLKIGDDKVSSEVSKAKTKGDAKQFTAEEIFKMHRQPTTVPVQTSPAKKPTADSTPNPNPKFNSVRFLEYLQSNELGLPHYSYFNVAKGKIQAQLVNPITGKVVAGAPCKDKQEACENVAGEVLKLIAAGNAAAPKLLLPPMPQIPQPPKNWTSQNKTAEKRQKPLPVKSLVDSSKKEPNALAETSKKEQDSPNAAAPLAHRNVSGASSAFVPLQAVRKHISKNTTPQKDDEKKKNQKNSQKSESASAANDDKKKENASEHNTSAKASETPAQSQKPKRHRKMRLAANFDTKPNI